MTINKLKEKTEQLDEMLFKAKLDLSLKLFAYYATHRDKTREKLVTGIARNAIYAADIFIQKFKEDYEKNNDKL